MFEFAAPWAFLLIAAVPFVIWRMRDKKRVTSISWSTAARASLLSKTWRQRTVWIVSALELLAVVLMIVAVARPRSGLTQRSFEGDGIAIELVIDRSGSMKRDDFLLDDKWVSRLDAVKDVAGQFISGDEMLARGTTDLVGLVTFAREADRSAPLTIDHDFVVKRLEQTNAAGDYREDGTAIGDAMALAVAGLNEYDNGRPLESRGTPLRKVVVLLTDGEQNAGTIDPLEAATLARDVDVTVHVIGLHSPGATAKEASAATLQQIAARTNGRFYQASDTKALAGIYQAIAELETSKLSPEPYTDFREWAIEPISVGSLVLPSLVAIALLLLSARVVLGRTIYRTLPE